MEATPIYKFHALPPQRVYFGSLQEFVSLVKMLGFVFLAVAATLQATFCYCNMLTFAFMHHSYFVCIPFSMPFPTSFYIFNVFIYSCLYS